MALADLLADPDAEWVYLVNAQPYYAAAVGWSQGQVINPLFGQVTRQYPPALTNAINVETWIDPLRLTGRTNKSIGFIEIANGEGTYDWVYADSWDGRTVNVRLGRPTDPYSEFGPIYNGRIRDIEFDERRVRILLRDPALFLDQPIQTHTYLGTGVEYEGSADLKDVPKPITIGACKSITPVRVDGTTPYFIYQVHDGSCTSINVYDSMFALAFQGNEADLTTGTLPTLGGYKTDLARGLFRLGGPPAGRLLCDVDGENAGLGATTKPTAIADVVRHILRKYAGKSDADLDLPSFADLNAYNARRIGYHVPATPGITIGQVITDVLDSCAGWWYQNASGDFVVGALRFQTSTRTLDRDAGQIAGIARIAGPAPIWRVRTTYDRMWTVCEPNTIAGTTSYDYAADASVSQAVRDRRSREWRYHIALDAAHKTLHAGAEELDWRTFYEVSGGASTESNILQALLEAHYQLFQVDARRVQHLINPGETITVVAPRYGFDSGVDCVVLGVQENSNTRATLLTVLA